MVVEYERAEDGSIVSVMPVTGDDVLLFRASDVRRDRTGIHATITIYERVDGVHRILDEDDIKPRAREERNRLANSAHAALKELKGAIDKESVQHEMLLFGRGLWEESLGDQSGEWTHGSLTPRETRFVLKPFIVERGGTIGFGPPKRGKSTISLAMAVSIDSGHEFFWPVQQGPVIYVNLERSKEHFADRLGAVNALLNQPRDRKLFFHHARGKSLSDVMDAVIRDAEREGAVCVFIDSLSRAGVGDLTENWAANKGMDLLNALPCAWWCVAHTPRADDGHVYGSQMFDAAADVLVQIKAQRMEMKTGVALRITEANEIGVMPPQYIAAEYGDSGLSELRWARPHEFPELEEQVQPLTNRDKVRLYMEQVDEASPKEVSSNTGIPRQTVSELLNSGEYAVVQRGRERVFSLPSGGTDENDRSPF